MSLFKKQVEYKLSDIEAGHFKVTYKGVPTVKCPFDYVLYQMLIWEVKPDLVVEIGTFNGGSTLYLADLLEMAGNGQVHTIDLPGNEVIAHVKTNPRISLFNEGYLNYDTGNLSLFNRILVIEDGSHQYEDTLNALKKFGPFVAKDSYFIVEDGIVTELGMEKKFNGGPQKAIAEFLAENKNFIIDRKWCDFFGHNATFNVNGYLKKTS